MATQPQIHGYIGDTASILLTMFGPKQHDNHVQRFRRVMRDRKLAAGVAQINENLRLGRPKWEGIS